MSDGVIVGYVRECRACGKIWGEIWDHQCSRCKSPRTFTYSAIVLDGRPILKDDRPITVSIRVEEENVTEQTKDE